MTIHRMPQDHRPRSAAPFTPAQQAFVAKAITTAALATGEKIYREIADEHAEKFEKLEAILIAKLDARLIELLEEHDHA